MKLKTIVLSLTSALYAAGVGAVAIEQSDSPIKQIKLTNASGNPFPAQTGQSNLLADVQQNTAGDVNVHINRGMNKKTFVKESGVSGINTYIVRIKGDSTSMYRGELTGLNATSLRAKKQLSNTNKLFTAGKAPSSEIDAYRSFLHSTQDSFAKSAIEAGVPLSIQKRFSNVFNGFSTQLTQEQALRISKLPNVEFVQRSKLHQLHTDIGPQIISADKAWTGETISGTELKGEGVIVGIIDTGINSDHASFADIGDDGYDHTNPMGAGFYVGDCALEEFADKCNDKLIGMRTYDIITKDYGDVPKTGEDYQGHGSHTAGTTAGNVIHNTPFVNVQLEDGPGLETGLNLGTTSGVAPHANIISYQVCYGTGLPTQGCPGEALIAAIEDAISDGVDVINFSIGGTEDLPWVDAVELAFLSAREAGIVVSASAGNSGSSNGPDSLYTADHSSPWLMSVAATTTGRTIEVLGKEVADFEGGDPNYQPIPSWNSATSIEGRGISDGFTGTPVLASNYGNDYCIDEFPVGTFTSDQIVICLRGYNVENNIARVEKAGNVSNAGAGGFILMNDHYSQETVNDVYPLPGIHINNDFKWDVENWVNNGTGHRLTITASNVSRQVDETRQDLLAGFSSRGPSSTYTEHLVPTVAAPGVEIYAAYADEKPFSTPSLAADWGMLSGTSMAAPHVAGAAALIKQAHPDWSATEIQSALTLTAENVVQMDIWETGNTEDFVDAYIYRAGSGRINVADAINTGLVMDETPERFIDANPQNGGVVRALNIPDLVNFNCAKTCTWLRTFRATNDGSWSAIGDTGEVSVDVTIEPAMFTLKAGEKQTVAITATILDSQNPYQNAEQELWAKVTLQDQNAVMPDSVLPMVFKYDHGPLPEHLTIEAHRNNDTYALKSIRSGAISDFNGRAFSPVKATHHEIKINEMQNISDEKLHQRGSLLEDGSNVLKLIDVPANAKRFIVEELELISTNQDVILPPHVDIFVGIDLNNDGIPNFEEEAICYSRAAILNNFCNINEPEAGTYWVAFEKRKTHHEEIEYDFVYDVATAIVLNEVASDMSVTAPSSNNGGADNYDLSINWNMPEMTPGDLYYTGIDIGTDSANPGNIGFVNMKLIRGEDEVQMDASQTKAKVGDIIDFKVKVAANNTGADRDFDLSAIVSEGMHLIPESISAFSSVSDALSVEGNTWKISSTQKDTSAVERQYKMVTNAEEAMCKMPDLGQSNAQEGTYIKLAEEFGILPEFASEWQPGNIHVPYINLEEIWGPGTSISFYENNQNRPYPGFALHPGWLDFGRLNMNASSGGHVKLPNNPSITGPDDLVAVNWKGYTEWVGWSPVLNSLYAPLVIDSYNGVYSGVSLAMTYSGKLLIDWRGMTTGTIIGSVNKDSIYTPGVNYRYYQYGQSQGDNYDAQVVLDTNEPKYDKGQYEIIKAYNNIEFASTNGAGSIGVQGFHGPRTSFGPFENNGDYLGTSFAYNDLDQKLTSGLVICYDYSGPEESYFEVSFQAVVLESGIGKDLTVQVDSNVPNIDVFTVEHTVSINTNVSIGHIDDQMIEENETLTGLEVIFGDNINTANDIMVSGNNISAEVSISGNMAAINITPDANFHGETEVTVTVQDKVHAADKASATFMLMVMSDGIELGCTDSTATNFDASANQDNGSCTFPVEPEKTKSSSGGSFGGVLMLVAAMFALRTRRMNVKR